MCDECFILLKYQDHRIFSNELIMYVCAPEESTLVPGKVHLDAVIKKNPAWPKH